MATISIWNSSRPKDLTDLEWTKQLLNELLDGQIHIEKNKLNSENSVKSLSDLTKMEIKKIETEQLKYFPSGYESRNYFGSDPVYDSVEKIDSVCSKAIAHAEQILNAAKFQHDRNERAIENNKLIIEGISEMMEKFGVKGSWTTWEYPSGRSRNKKEVVHSCSWGSEVNRFINTTDGLSSIQLSHDSFLKSIQSWKEKKLKELDGILLTKRLEEDSKVKARALAKFQVKYDLPASSSWEDIYDYAEEKYEEDLEEISKFYTNPW